MMEIGEKVRVLRQWHGLTQAELAVRCDLSKGFISQLESDQASPSIATLMDILEALGTNLREFFSEPEPEMLVYSPADIFQSTAEDGICTHWLVPNSQKNDMEPIIIELPPKTATPPDDPHAGEEFGYVLAGAVTIHMGDRVARAKKGESFYLRATQPHYVENKTNTTARLLWVATPPTF